VNLLRSRRGVVILGLALLLGLFLLRPGANRLHTRIVRSISLALGRPVEVGWVSLRLLPRPGFELENFVVEENPAFGAEPVLRAQEVNASLRVSSLLQGRLEIARLSLTEPSFNLVRNADGHWNLESLLERVARMPIAPTAKARTEPRPGFPYIEADRGRINLKVGAEKKPYALTEADFALWQDSENTWGMRLKAQPVRTDFNLSDTGLVAIDGYWQRTAILRNTPLQFNVSWDHAQLGQVSKLMYGNDQGWRGRLKLTTGLIGTPANLRVSAATVVQNFRRYDIFDDSDLRLMAQCSGRYRSSENLLSEIACRAPVGEGSVTLSGRVANPLGSRDYDLSLAAQEVPIPLVAALIRHIKNGMPEQLAATGTLTARMTVRRHAEDDRATLDGAGETSDFRLQSSLTNADLILDRIPFSLISTDAKPSSWRNSATPALHLDMGPFNLPLGRASSARVQGWVSPAGYSFAINGDAQVRRLLQVARILGITTLQPAADGIARFDLQVARNWSEGEPRQLLGKAQLQSVRADVRGLSAPLEIAAANLVLTPGEVRVQNLAASIAGASWRGSLSLPRQCAVAGTCPIRFDLHADTISLDRMNQLLNPRLRKQPWYHFLSVSPASPYLLTLDTIGNFTANQVLIHNLVARKVSARMDLQGGKLHLSQLSGDVLGGRHKGDWSADFTAKPPEFSGSGTVERLSLSELADTMHDAWVTGSATAAYRATASGLSAAELLASATAALQIEAHNGSLPHIVLSEAAGPLQMHSLTAELTLQNGKFEVLDGQLESSTGRYELSGTASLGHLLNLKLAREGSPGFEITGTIAAPRVVQTAPAETQAALKP